MCTLAVMASVTCGQLLAAGYDADILSWLPSAATFGKPLEPDFVLGYDKRGDFTKEVTAAFPDCHEESLVAWCNELCSLCERKERQTLSFLWKPSAVPARSQLHESRLITPKAGMGPSDLKNFAKAPIRPAPSRISTGSDPGGASS